MVQEGLRFEVLERKLEKDEAVVCVIGAGYVGLPLCVEFARSGLKVIGFDLSQEKVDDLNKGVEATGELDEGYLRETLDKHGLVFTTDPGKIREGDFVIVCVPTPINDDKEPDLSFVSSSGSIVGQNLKKGGVVVLESTVYPGVTEDFLKPLLEEESSMVCGRDFSIGYSPERVNPGDKEHDLRTVVKVVSGLDGRTADVLESLYGRIVEAGVFRARDIKTAEAAKVIENIQRDLNIALVNELSMIFRRMGINTKDVLEAAGTKWNFHKYSPGLVGGHCIPVDPYYLVHKSKGLGYEPRVILAGREINDSMPVVVARSAIEALRESGKKLEGSRVLLLGLTFKKNVKDTRNAPVKNMIKTLKGSGLEVLGFDPLLERSFIRKEFGIEALESLDGVGGVDCVITVTDHDVLVKDVGLEALGKVSGDGAVIVDIRGMFSPDKARESGFKYIGF